MSPIRPENRELYPSNWKAIRAEVMERHGARDVGGSSVYLVEECMSETFRYGYHLPPITRRKKVPIRYYWTLHHPMSGYYFGEES